jgi:hypothetical protein
MLGETSDNAIELARIFCFLHYNGITEAIFERAWKNSREEKTYLRIYLVIKLSYASRPSTQRLFSLDGILLFSRWQQMLVLANCGQQTPNKGSIQFWSTSFPRRALGNSSAACP